MNPKQSKYKRQNIIIISIVVGIILLFGGMVSFRKYQAKQQQAAVEQNARKEIALYIVRNYQYKESIKELDFTSFSKPTIFGGGGYSTDVSVNGKKKTDHLFISVDDIKHPVVDGEVFSFEGTPAWKESKNKHRTLDHIKIGYWR